MGRRGRLTVRGAGAGLRSRPDLTIVYTLHAIAGAMILAGHGHTLDFVPDWAEEPLALVLWWAAVWGLLGRVLADLRAELVALPASILTLAAYTGTLAAAGRWPSATIGLVSVALIWGRWRHLGRITRPDGEG